MKKAVLLIGHGTVERLDDLPAFLANIRRGHAAPTELVAEVRRRYEAIGGKSPLTELSRSLARKVEGLLRVPVRLAMRLWEPYPEAVLRELAAEGDLRVAVVPLAQHSAHVYAAAVRAGAEKVAAETGRRIDVAAAPNWGNESGLLDAYAALLEASIAELARPDEARVVMTAHSLPVAVLRGGDPYEREMRASADAVGARIRASRPKLRPHVVAFQSQGMGTGADGKPMEWLGPELRPALEAIARDGAKDVVVAPIGFLADHVEILYDLDIEAQAWAKELGVHLHRTRSLNDSDALARVVADVAAPLLQGGGP
jgi:ferrochelatase